MAKNDCEQPEKDNNIIKKGEIKFWIGIIAIISSFIIGFTSLKKDVEHLSCIMTEIKTLVTANAQINAAQDTAIALIKQKLDFK